MRSPARRSCCARSRICLLAPRDLGAREHALRGASACAAAFDRGTPGAQHALAHLLGGALGVEHAPLHAILLPHFIAHLRTTKPAVVAELERAVDRPDLDAYLHDLLVRAGAPVALDALGGDGRVDRCRARGEAGAAGIDRARRATWTASAGRAVDASTSARSRWHCSPGQHPSSREAHRSSRSTAAAPSRARSFAGCARSSATIPRRRSSGFVPRTEPRAGTQCATARRAPATTPEVLRAIDRVEAALRGLPTEDDPCRLLARRMSRARGRVAHGGTARWRARTVRCAHRPGRRVDAPPRSLAGLPVLLGAAEHDKWIARADLDATRAWFEKAGASVDDVSGPGEKHEITLRQRMRARELVLGAAPRGTTGFGNTIESEALPGAIPALQNSPRLPAYGLYAEQLNGTGFTAPRADNQRIVAVSRAAVGAAPRVRAGAPAAARRDIRRVAGDQPVRLRAAARRGWRARLRRRSRHAMRRRLGRTAPRLRVSSLRRESQHGVARVLQRRRRPADHSRASAR